MATFTNQAQLSYGNTVLNSNIAVGEIVEVLTANKNAISASYTTGEDVTYTVSIINSGTTDYKDLTITDNLGAITVGTATVYPLSYKSSTVNYYVNGVLQTTPEVTEGPPLVISGISVPANGNAMLIYETTVTNYASPATDALITNTATISGTGISTPISVEFALVSNDVANLAINKSINPTSVTENSRVTYTFTIYNYGNTAAVAGDNAIVNDTFNPILTNISVTYNGTTWADTTNYTYDDTTGTFATVGGQITIPAATYTQNSDGSYTIDPGVSTLVVTGTI